MGRCKISVHPPQQPLQQPPVTATLLIVGLVLLTTLLPVPARAQEPFEGLYWMEAVVGSSSTDFSAWYTVIPLATPGRYSVRDLTGFGWNATLLSNGVLQFDGGYLGQVTAGSSFTANLIPNLTHTFQRAPTTDSDFLVLLPSTSAASSSYATRAGVYRSATQALDPATGRQLLGTTENMTLTVNGNELRLTTGSGVFYEGIFADDSHVAFRIIGNVFTGWVPQFASYAGTLSNSGFDVVGELRFLNQNMFECTLALQTRTAAGSQMQQLLRFSALRAGLQIPGDFDQDGRAGITDITQWLSFLFTSNQPPLPCYDDTINVGGNQELLDSNGSGNVDLADVVHHLNFLFLGGPTHTLGAACVPIFRCPTTCP